MNNQYKTYLETFFTTLLGYRHSTRRLNTILINDAKIYSKKDASYRSGSTLVISDWSGLTDKGWEINFNTRITKQTLKSEYAQEIRDIISRECCLIYAQSFEALERLLKDSLFFKSTSNSDLQKYLLSQLKKDNTLTREKMPGGDNLFKGLMLSRGNAFEVNSKGKNLNIRYSELWRVLSEARHSIVHSNSVLKFSKINRSKHHLAVFELLFNYSRIDDDYISIQLEYPKFERLIKRLSEFAFQVFKSLCIEENIEWNVYE